MFRTVQQPLSDEAPEHSAATMLLKYFEDFFPPRKCHVFIAMDADILLAEILKARQPPLMTFRIDKPHCPYRMVFAQIVKIIDFCK